MARGTLYGVLRDQTIALAWQRRVDFAADVARAMLFLHNAGFLHRDLKSLNVLVNKQWCASAAPPPR